MKNVLCLVLFLLVLFTTPALLAQDALTLAILSSLEMVTDYGNPVETFEDVEPITGIKANYADSGPITSEYEIRSKFENFARKSTADAFFALMGRYGGLVCTDPPMTFGEFLKDVFYLDSGHYATDDSTGAEVWRDEKFRPTNLSLEFNDYADTGAPRERKFFLCLDADFDCVKSFPQPPPNSVSCQDHRAFCNYPPCEREKEVDDPDNPGMKITKPSVHEQTVPNIYKHLASEILAQITLAQRVIEKQSGIEFTMKFEDRTPPRIDGCVGGDFPELGVNVPATTGDWFKVDGLKITDNSGGKIGVALLLGKIDTSPMLTWASEEDWILEKPEVIESGANTDQMVMPNSCHGFMRYTLYAWDRHGNLNPGEPDIHENDPENCYGLGPTVVGNVNANFDGSTINTNLSKDPGNAREWPIKVEFRKPEDFDDTYINDLKARLNSDFRRGEGYINIKDNDLPNIVIRIESVKDKSRIFFPPVMAHGDPEFTIVYSSKYRIDKAPADSNVADYRSFLLPDPDLPMDIPFQTRKLIDGSQELYFKIVDVVPSDVMQPSEQNLLVDRLKNSPDPDFIRKHFRLEDYIQSDMRQVDGAPDLDPDTFGQRNSYGKRVVALLELSDNKAMIQEDVEYLIDVWADDNIKWATIDSAGQRLTNVVSIPTGIAHGEMSVEIPNQYPRASYHVPFNDQESVNGKLRVVFREPTLPDAAGNSEADLLNQKFPYIDVKAVDYAGLERSIRLFLRVTNENPNIRVLDRKHEQNR